MLVIDSSVLIAILLNEPEKYHFSERLSLSEENYMSASNYVETGIVIYSKMKEEGLKKLKQLISDAEIKIYEVNEEIAELAIEAFAKYGKGVHKAGLNYGDCFSYATAKYLNAELLYKGKDFDRITSH